MLKIEELILEGEFGLNLSRISYAGIKPGDIVSFTYEQSSRLGLVVKSQRTSTGYFLSTRNNTLLNVFLLDSISSGLFSLLVNNLYKDRVRCSYMDAPRILGAFLGKDNFRTFNVARIENLFSLLINND